MPNKQAADEMTAEDTFVAEVVASFEPTILKVASNRTVMMTSSF